MKWDTSVSCTASLSSDSLCFHLKAKLIGLLDRTSFDGSDAVRIITPECRMSEFPGDWHSGWRRERRKDVVDLLKTEVQRG
jgi:hypothetical protein